MQSLLSSGLVDQDRSAAGAVRTGQIVHISPAGCLFVDFPGNEMGPVEAHVLSHPACRFHIGDRVLLAFEADEASPPVVMGTVKQRMPQPENEVELSVVDEGSSKKQAVIDGRTISLDAKQEIVLRCGKSSITLKKDGKIVIKGTHLVSRASQTNRIKGGSVAIN